MASDGKRIVDRRDPPKVGGTCLHREALSTKSNIKWPSDHQEINND